MGGGMMGPKKKMARGGPVKKMGGGMMGPKKKTAKMMGGGMMEATQRLRRQGLRGGGLCKKGMNREAIGKNS